VRNNKLHFRYYYQVPKVDKIIKRLKHAHIITVDNSNFLSLCLVKHFSSFGIKKIEMIKTSKNEIFKNRIENLTPKDIDVLILSSIGNENRVHEEINKICIKNDIPFLTSRLFTDRAEIGPFVIPHKTACYICYKKRTESNLLDSKRLKNKVKKIPVLYPIIEIFSGYVSLEILGFLTSYGIPVTIGNVIFVNFKTLKTEIHPLLKIPYCPVCGEK